MSDFSPQETDATGVTGSFFWESVANPDAHTTPGAPLYNQVPYVRIITDNAKYSMPVGPVNDDHKQRWPRAWAQFESGEPGLPEGEMPIEHFPGLNRAQVDHMRARRILSVNQLAHVSDATLDMVVTRDLRERAKQHLQGDGEAVTQLRREKADMQSQLKDAMIRIAQLEQAVAARDDGDDKPAKPRRARKAA